MRRISTATAVPDLFGPGKPGFRDGNKGASIAATELNAEHFNGVQEELVAIIEGAGLDPSEADLTQVRQAIQLMIVSAQQAVIINEAVFEASVADGDAVYWDAANTHFALALADGTAAQNAVGVADVTNAKMYSFGSCSILSGLIPGARYFLSTTNPGAITSVAPASTIIQIGIAKSASELFVDIDAGAVIGMPPGTVFYHAGITAPLGSLKLNGAGILVADYPALTSAVYCGDANNATAPAFYRADSADGTGRNLAGAYLILADARGEFLRAFDDGRGVDVSRVFASAQSDLIKAHNHILSNGGTTVLTASGSGKTLTGLAAGSSVNGGASIENTGGVETRPRNLSFLACIRY